MHRRFLRARLPREAEAHMGCLSPRHTVALRHFVVDGPGWWCASEKSVPGHRSGGRAVV